MADENTEEKKKGGLLRLLMFIGGGVLLVGIGLGVGFFLFGRLFAHIKMYPVQITMAIISG